MKHLIYALIFVLPILSSCSAEQASTESSTAIMESETFDDRGGVDDENSFEDSFNNYDTGYTVKILMNDSIQAHAMQLWQAVRYVVTAEGIEEDISPQTDEDWLSLHDSATALIELANALLSPARIIDNSPLDIDYPDFQYRPEEIQVLREAEPGAWRYYIEEMKFSTQATIAAIERQDVLGLIETGAAINNACEGCHGEFWYRQE